MPRGCVTGKFRARWLVKAPGVLGSVLSSFQACFCKHGQTSDIYITLFTLGLIWLIRPQLIKSIKYGHVPRNK